MILSTPAKRKGKTEAWAGDLDDESFAVQVLNQMTLLLSPTPFSNSSAWSIYEVLSVASTTLHCTTNALQCSHIFISLYRKSTYEGAGF